MKSYKKHLAHQNTSNSLAKKTLMKHASGGRMMSRKDKTTMKAATIKSQEEKVKIAETIADEMIDVACKYANKWGRTSGVGFVTMYGDDQGITILDENGLRSFFKQQKNNLVDCIENGGRATTGVLKGKSFKLNRGNIDATIRKIFLGYIYRLGIAVDTSGKKNVLEGIFSRLIRSDIKNFKSEEKGKGGISSYIEAIARFSDKKLNPYYWQNIEGWKILFEKLDKVVYLLDSNGCQRNNLAKEIKKAIVLMERYAGSNIKTDEDYLQDIHVQCSYEMDSKIRKVIENYSMTKCISYYKSKGYKCEDVSQQESFDVLATKGKETLKIEVKGTRGLGDKIIMTKNEVDLAKRDKTILFLVCNIIYDYKTGKTFGGEERILKWNFTPSSLIALSYSYQIQ